MHPLQRLLRGEAYPSLVPAPGEDVHGAVLDGVDAEALAQLDTYEGALYERIGATATLADGAEVAVWLWLVRAAERHRVGEEPFDLATFVARDLARFEAEYVAEYGAGSGSSADAPAP